MKSIFATILVLIALAAVCRADTTVYYPNSTGADGIHYYASEGFSRDGDNGCEYPYGYDGTELNTVSVDDANGVLTEYACPQQGHRFRIPVSEEVGTITSLAVTAKGLGQDATEDISIFIALWNNTTSAWVVLDTLIGAGTLTGSVTANIPYYVNAYTEVCLFFGINRAETFGTVTRLTYIELDVTYGAGPSPARRVIVTSGNSN